MGCIEISQLNVQGNADNDGTETSAQCSGLREIHGKAVASAFWSYQLEEELRKEDYIFKTMDQRMLYDTKRVQTVYSHDTKDCCDECRRRGRETL